MKERRWNVKYDRNGNLIKNRRRFLIKKDSSHADLEIEISYSNFFIDTLYDFADLSKSKDKLIFSVKRTEYDPLKIKTTEINLSGELKGVKMISDIYGDERDVEFILSSLSIEEESKLKFNT